MNRLKDKIAVITGGTSGIGLATARRLIAEGANAVITGRNRETVEAAVNELGDRCTGFAGDVSNLDDIDKLYARVKDRFGRVDILFANAGIAPFVPVEQVDERHFDQVFGINVRGLFFSVQRAIPLLSEGSSVILTASVASETGNPGASVYSATKAAVRSFGRTFAAELGPRGIRVNVVSPGLVITPLFEKIGMNDEDVAGLSEMVSQRTPLGRPGRPEEIAAAVAFLAFRRCQLCFRLGSAGGWRIGAGLIRWFSMSNSDHPRSA